MAKTQNKIRDKIVILSYKIPAPYPRLIEERLNQLQGQNKNGFLKSTLNFLMPVILGTIDAVLLIVVSVEAGILLGITIAIIVKSFIYAMEML